MGITIGAYIDGGGHVPAHMKDVAAHDGIERLLVSGSDEAREVAAQMPKAQFVADWDALLADDDLPALIVLTNNRNAGRLNVQAVEAGKWVYGEKPGARTAAEMAAIVEACRRSGAHFTPCYARRTFADTLEIKRLIKAGALGELWSFQANWIASQAELRGVDWWGFREEIAGGGILYWLGCHWIDAISFVTGQRIAEVSALCTTAEPRISVEDVACLSLRLEGGAIGTLRCGYLLNPYEGYEDCHLMTAWEGSDGWISHHPHGAVTLRARSRTHEVADLVIDRTGAGGYAPALLSDFIKAVETGRRPLVCEDDALYVLRVIEAAYASSRTGAAVKVRS